MIFEYIVLMREKPERNLIVANLPKQNKTIYTNLISEVNKKAVNVISQLVGILFLEVEPPADHR